MNRVDKVHSFPTAVGDFSFCFNAATDAFSSIFSSTCPYIIFTTSSTTTAADATGNAKSFGFTLAAVTEGAPMPESAEATLEYAAGATGEQAIPFGNITYTAAGKYEYTITEADAYAVLKSMKKYIRKALLAGRRVVLTDLGSMKLSLRSRCFSQDTMAASDFSPSAMIKGIAVNFRPESKLITELRANVQYERIVEE